MSFIIRHYRRFPVYCPVTYHAGLSEGHGMVWNLSVNGWRLSGDVPLCVGQTCPLTVHFPNQLSLFVASAVVRWVRGQEYGMETMLADTQTQSRVEQLVHQLKQGAFESIESATTAKNVRLTRLGSEWRRE